MRITENSIAYNYLLSVNQARERLVKLQSDLATGKRVLKASDDPQAADVILRLKVSLDRNEQFEKNVQDGQSVMEMTASALDSFSNVLLDAKETLTKASNGTQSESFQIFADKLDQLLCEGVNIANTKYNGKYIFGGTNTLDPPYTLAADHSTVMANPNGISGIIEYEVGEGIKQEVNIDGQSAFQGTQIFSLLIKIRDDLRAGIQPNATDVDTVTNMLQNVTGYASKAGSIMQNLDTLTTHLADQKTQLMSLLSLEQDTDVAEATMKLKHEELMLDAALNTGARIIPKSLLDFLK